MNVLRKSGMLLKVLPIFFVSTVCVLALETDPGNEPGQESELRIYDVKDLTDFINIIESRIPVQVAPGTWKSNWNNALEERAGKLIVLHIPSVQVQVGDWLHQFRDPNAQQRFSAPPLNLNQLAADLGSEQYQLRERAELILRCGAKNQATELQRLWLRSEDLESKTRLKAILTDLNMRSWISMMDQGLNGPLAARLDESLRDNLMKQEGVSRAAKFAMGEGLQWLARNQEKEGCWSASKHSGKTSDLTVTGLALLAFLSSGNCDIGDKYASNVKKGLEWVMAHQRPNGAFQCESEFFIPGRDHGIAALAVCEAAMLVRSPQTVRSAHAAVQYSSSDFQLRGEDGLLAGWPARKGEPRDFESTGWITMHLLAARWAGIEVDSACLDGAKRFYIDEQIEIHGPTLAAQRSFIRSILSTSQDRLRTDISDFTKVGGWPQWKSNDQTDLMYWHWASLACFRAGGAVWDRWWGSQEFAICSNQRKGGDEDGSWDLTRSATTSWGRVGQTALAVLCLQTYGRYLFADFAHPSSLKP